MSTRVLLPFQGAEPVAGEGLDAAPTARVVGRARLGAGCVLRACATLRGDGQAIEVGDGCWFGEHSTVHIVHYRVPTRIGSGVTVGARALAHAVEIGDGAVVGEGAILLDEAVVEPGAAVAAHALVPPRKRLRGGALYAGVPAAEVRPLAEGELERLHAAARGRAPEPPGGAASAPARIVAADGALVCETVEVEGTLVLGAAASVWFGTRVVAPRGRVAIGARANVQDNSTLLAADDVLEIGARVTVGHNVTLEPCRIGDGALVANGSRVGRGTVVEAGACVAAAAEVPPGSVVPAGMVWAGRPARLLRPLTEEERRRFGEIPDVYADAYRPFYAPSR